jgi:hypothetical protein
MPSRAEIRGGAENVLRVLSIGILAWMLWLSLDRAQPDTAVSARSTGLATALRDWSSRGIPPDRITAQLDSIPSAVQADWLRALRGAGSDVAWNGDLPAIAVGAERVVSPRGGFTVLVSAPGKMSVRLEDEVGTLDTATAANGGVRFSIPSATGEIRAIAGNAIASTLLPDSVQPRRVLVIGGAGWESKFVVAALEEDGWKVDADMRVAPGVTVTQGSLSQIDTARYSAVIALDGTAASRASEIVRYAASGGGVILAGGSAALEAFGAIRPGVPGRITSGATMAAEPGSASLRSLSINPVAALRGDAIPLERREGSITTAARRHEAGRVLQLGYADTWRWRMSGGDASPDEHREWWTRSVASVAYAPRSLAAAASEADKAPVARLVATLGPPSTHPEASLASTAASVSLWLLAAVLALSLLGEWASRRLRGMR